MCHPFQRLLEVEGLLISNANSITDYPHRLMWSVRLFPTALANSGGTKVEQE